jgi:hypothetical protein
MNKVLFSAFVVVGLLLSVGKVGAQEEQSEAERRARIAEEVRERHGTDPNRPIGYQETMRARYRDSNQERHEDRRKELMEYRRRLLEEREKSLKERGIDPAKSTSSKGKDAQQALAALQKQITQEEQKHARRWARLKRVQELAAESNSQEMLTRVEQLIQRERGRNQSKLLRLQTREHTLKRLVDRRSRAGADEKRRLGPEGRPEGRPGGIRKNRRVDGDIEGSGPNAVE